MGKYNFDKADKEKMKEFFEAADYSEDKKCSLAGTVVHLRIPIS
ncbi:unnamed protein product [Penicillium salamii]|nr:unnamed protein product [Penicillium salamii]CAG8328188.1 unnamed protein product [Penicillium salamii]